MFVNILNNFKCPLFFGCLFLLLLVPIRAIEQSITTTNSPTTTTATLIEAAKSPPTLKFTAANVLHVTKTGKDGPTKRNVELSDLSEAGSAAAAASAKSYDPPPEYYRGPGSASTLSNTASSATSANSYNNRNTVNSVKPFSFPDTNARNKYNTDNSVQLANEYKNWQLQRGQQNNQNRNYNNIKDRISVGHYGSSGHSHTDYGYDPHHAYIDTPHHDYGYYADTGHGGGYYSSGTSSEGVHFDLYGSKGHLPHGHGTGHGAGGGHYAGAGGEYSYTYPELHEHSSSYNSKEQAEHKALLAKSFLIPLASAAVLGIAAALVSNPLLLQLGTVSGGVGVGPTIVGKRKRRDLSRRLPPAESSERTTADGSKLAYRGYRLERGLSEV